LYEETVSKGNSQIIYLGFTYRFGKSTKNEKQKEEFKFEDSIK